MSIVILFPTQFDEDNDASIVYLTCRIGQRSWLWEISEPFLTKKTVSNYEEEARFRLRCSPESNRLWVGWIPIEMGRV